MFGAQLSIVRREILGSRYVQRDIIEDASIHGEFYVRWGDWSRWRGCYRGNEGKGSQGVGRLILSARVALIDEGDGFFVSIDPSLRA